ncbi:hypothetical protein LTR62_007651 [Meristemomyces frigidus]|uniref:Putative transcription factor kapC n=1 Tax=Meristemomyces frigidus TaxID=1508187 RepID=A0AAN7YNT1_9PEZI|nr:hypothetical protein LTR62_007651 [Meristemomyces frigidus]
MSLREQLLAAGSSTTNNSPYPPPPTAGAPGPDHPYAAGPDQHHPIDQGDPNAAQQQHVPYAQMSGDDGAEEAVSPGGTKGGKRELSMSKRAAQNRAAQRAFRQRKEGYIKKLEEQVKELSTMEQNYRLLQNENYQYREYILTLQRILLESSSDFPPAPAQANLPATSSVSSVNRPPPGSAEHDYRAAPSQQPLSSLRDEAHDGMSHLQAAAAQAEAASRGQHDSPYGLGGGAEYARAREDGNGDAKAAI